ncbi:MAG: DUF2656 domain-containing protein [Pseudanabaenales cyanobacterium]|nr:DUF2656 domain-containing protein [Pseudanabaenales cyanobacterium]
MKNNLQGRMLLSHNFDISPDIAPPLNREEFAAVFRLGLSPHITCQCSQVNHPPSHPTPLAKHG